MRITKAVAPKNLTELLRMTCLVKWRGLSCEKQFCSNVMEAVEAFDNDIELTSHQIAQYKVQLSMPRGSKGKVLADSTINQKLINLHTVLHYGYENGWIKSMPLFKFHKIDDARTRVLSHTEEARFVQWFEENGHFEMAGFVELLILTGCRWAEIAKCKPEQIDGEWLQLWVTKTRKIRSVWLSPRAQYLAAKYIPIQMKYMAMYRLWVKAKRKLGFKPSDKLVMHAMRHTAATRLLRKSGNISIVKLLLGHKSLKTSERYAKLFNEDLKAAMALPDYA